MLIRKGGNREGVTNQWRIVTDYRELNKRTKSSRYTPPNIRAVLDHMPGEHESIFENGHGGWVLPNGLEAQRQG